MLSNHSKCSSKIVSGQSQQSGKRGIPINMIMVIDTKYQNLPQDNTKSIIASPGLK